MVNEINDLLSDVAFLDRLPRTSPSSLELLQRVLELSRLHSYLPGEVQAVARLSQQALDQADYTQAISYGRLVTTRFSQLDGITPWLADAHYILAQAQQALGNEQDAIGHYGQLIDIIDSNDDPDVYIPVTKYTAVINLIDLYERNGDITQANALATEHSELLNPTLPLASRVSFPTPRSSLRIPRSFIPRRRSCLPENPGSVNPVTIPLPPSPFR